MTTPDTDTRPALTDVEQVAQLVTDLEDLRTTMMARVARRPTGDVEMTIRTSPKPDSVFMQGQTLSREEYPALWMWVQDQGLAPAVFGTGNGSTTFVLPDMRGRTVVGADTGRPVGTKFGDQTRVILPANMANHTHQVAIRDHMSNTGQAAAEVGSQTRDHGHPSVGDHVHASHGHSAAIPRSDGGSTNVGPVVVGSQVSPAGGHYHGVQGNGHEHFLHIPSHVITEVVVGNSTPFNIEQPSVTINWLIYV